MTPTIVWSLDEDECKEMGLSVGQRKRYLKMANNLQSDPKAPLSTKELAIMLMNFDILVFFNTPSTYIVY